MHASYVIILAQVALDMVLILVLNVLLGFWEMVLYVLLSVMIINSLLMENVNLVIQNALHATD